MPTTVARAILGFGPFLGQLLGAVFWFVVVSWVLLRSVVFELQGRLLSMSVLSAGRCCNWICVTWEWLLSVALSRLYPPCGQLLCVQQLPM